MKRTRSVSVLALLGAASLALTACGLSGGSGGSGGAAVDSAALVEQIAAVSDEQLQGTTITMSRFFGDCEETTAGITDVSLATNECEAIQILTNQFNQENEWGITVERLGGAAWHSYYDGLNAALASSDRPDVAVMHGSNLPDYASRGMLVPVPEGMGIDLTDATDPASEAITYDDLASAIPFDTHAVISHLNMDLLEQAGLTNADGTYTMPTSPEAFMADAEKFTTATGKPFIDIALSNDPMGGRLWMSLVWQQGEEFIDADARTASMTSEASTNALQFINDLVDKGYTTPQHDYDASTQAFLNGEAGILFNGVWAVNQYTLEAPFHYEVTDAPQLFERNASWANSHIWVVPVQADGDPVQYRAAFEFANFLYQHTGDWAIATGHMASSVSAIESDAYLAAPHREQYILTATTYGHMQPPLVEWPAIGDLVQEKLEATWLTGTSVTDALAELQAATEAELR